MHHPSAPGQRAAALAFSGRVTARQRPLSTADQLERLSSRLDVLIRDVRNGAISHRQHEQHIAEAEEIATELRGIFRGRTTQHPPLQQQGGRAWW